MVFLKFHFYFFMLIQMAPWFTVELHVKKNVSWVEIHILWCVYIYPNHKKPHLCKTESYRAMAFCFMALWIIGSSSFSYHPWCEKPCKLWEKPQFEVLCSHQHIANNPCLKFYTWNYGTGHLGHIQIISFIEVCIWG